MKKVFGHLGLYVLALCQVLVVGLLYSSPVQAASGQTYEFELRNHNHQIGDYYEDEWTNFSIEGNDVDFYSVYWFGDSSDGIPNRYSCIYALSSEPFTYSYYRNSRQNNGSEWHSSVTQRKSTSTIVDGQTVYWTSYSLSASTDLYSLENFSGWPNLYYMGVQHSGEDFENGIIKDFFNEQLKEFVANGGLVWESGSGDGATYDDSLPIIKSLIYSNLKPLDCHGRADQTGCFNLSWNIPEGAKKDDVLEIRASCNYNYSTYWGTKRLYDSGFFDFSIIYGLIPISNTSADFCVTDFISSLDIKDINGFTLLPQKIYIRIVRDVSGKRSYGDWVVYDVDRDVLNYPEIGKGEVIPGDVEFDDMGNSFETPKEIIDPSDKNNESFDFDFTDVSSVLRMFKNTIQSLIDVLGVFPSLFSTVFGFLPAPIANSFLLVFIVAIFVGILKIFT